MPTSTPVPSSPTEPAAVTATITASASATQQQQQQQQQGESIYTCRYPSKKCWNSRALKRNGEMHNLCDLHREKANKNQRRLEQKRKTSKKVAANAKRARKSHAAAKSKAAGSVVRSIKQPARQQPRKRPAPTAATASDTDAAVSATSSTTLHQTQMSMAVSIPVSMQPPTSQSTSTLPVGFFTDLMMSDTVYAKQPETSWAPMVVSQQSHLYQRYLKATSVVSMDDLLDGDLDSLADCLDSIPPTSSSAAALFAATHASSSFSSSSSMSSLLGLVGGGSSPIDVCDGLDAVAAVSDFWWHPVAVNVDPVLDAMSSMTDELFASQHC